METSGMVRLAGGKNFALRPYKLIELAAFYGMHRNTFRTWLDPFREKIGKRKGHYYTIVQVITIVKSLGIPATIDYNEFL